MLPKLESPEQVADLRARVWMRLTDTVPPVPAGTAFALHALGFLRQRRSGEGGGKGGTLYYLSKRPAEHLDPQRMYIGRDLSNLGRLTYRSLVQMPVTEDAAKADRQPTLADFAAEGFEPRDHLELGELLGAIDMERGTKVSGSRFYFLTGIGARLEYALMSLALQRAVDAGFIPMIPPTLVRPEIMRGTGFLGQHADEVYKLEADDLYLVGTSEVPLAGYHMGEILDLSAGAKRYAGWSTCYRREAGSYGKDTRGIIRVHQFNKLEMFVYTTPEDAEAEHLRLVEMQELMLQDLGLSYRVIDVAAGDLGSSAARKYDIEAWVPTQGAYRELTSTSNCTTYQARRLDIRHRPDGGKTTPVATLNGTLATTRWIVALLETHQRADGSVMIPEVLRPYLGGIEVAEPIA